MVESLLDLLDLVIGRDNYLFLKYNLLLLSIYCISPL